MNREPGYYWVKFAGTWQPARLVEPTTFLGDDWWSIIDSKATFLSRDFDEIGERIIHN